MGKTVRKFMIGDIWRIGEHESWFSDMARAGLHLKKIKGIAYFTKGEPKETRYRIDTLPNKNLSEEERELYRASGWEHVTNFGEMNVFSSPEELNAPELHTDPAEQSYTLESLDKKIRANTWIVATLFLAVTIVNFLIVFILSKPILALVEGAAVLYICTIMIQLYAIYMLLRATQSIRRLRKTLADGKPINHQAAWKKQRRIQLIGTTTILAIGILAAVLPFVQMIMRSSEVLPIEDVDLPIVRLADIEQNPDLIREEPIEFDGIPPINRVDFSWSPFAPVQYESNETGIIPGEIWKDGSGTYSPSIWMNVYRLSFAWMIEDLISELIAKDEVFFSDGDLQKVESEFFENLWIRENEWSREVFASRGKVVNYVRYFGEADIEQILKTIEEKMVLLE